jgi:hypothetical protein
VLKTLKRHFRVERLKRVSRSVYRESQSAHERAQLAAATRALA